MALPWPDNPYGFSTNTSIAQCNLTVAKALGLTMVRRIMSWSNLEPSSGTYDATTQAQLDTEIQLAYTNQINFTLCLDTPPSWALTTYNNGCSNISASAALATMQYLLNRYNGGTVANAVIAAYEFANEGYDDVGFGLTCQSFENVVPVLQSIYPWKVSNYPNVLIGSPAHFNRQGADYTSVQASLYTGFYGTAKGLFDYSNFHWYGNVHSNGVYTGPDGPQSGGADTFQQAITDMHAADVAGNNGSVPLYCTETGVAVPGTGSVPNTEIEHSAYFVGGLGCNGVYPDAINSNGALSKIYLWTIQNSNGYSPTSGCATITYLPSFYAIQGFIKANPTWTTNTLAAKKAAIFALRH